MAFRPLVHTSSVSQRSVGNYVTDDEGSRIDLASINLSPPPPRAPSSGALRLTSVPPLQRLRRGRTRAWMMAQEHSLPDIASLEPSLQPPVKSKNTVPEPPATAALRSSA